MVSLTKSPGRQGHICLWLLLLDCKRVGKGIGPAYHLLNHCVIALVSVSGWFFTLGLRACRRTPLAQFHHIFI